MNTTFNKNFPANVWALSVLIGSILFGVFLLFEVNITSGSEFFSALLLLILFSGVFSWPTFLLCYFALRYFTKSRMLSKYAARLIYVVALLGILVTAIFFEIFEERILIIGLTCYIIGLTASFFALKIGTTN